MEAGTPVGDGEVCPKCGDRLPTKRERQLERELARKTSRLAGIYGLLKVAELSWRNNLPDVSGDIELANTGQEAARQGPTSSGIQTQSKEKP
jgi:hypothetical protein